MYLHSLELNEQNNSKNVMCLHSLELSGLVPVLLPNRSSLCPVGLSPIPEKSLLLSSSSRKKAGNCYAF